MLGKLGARFFGVFFGAFLAIGLVLPSIAHAVRKGLVVNDEAAVFDQPDFDSTVIMTLQPGRVFDISDNKRGPFYKIRYDANKIGWISDADIQPISNDRARELQAKTQKPAAPRRPDNPNSMSVEPDPNEPPEDAKPAKASRAKAKKSSDKEDAFGMQEFGDEQSEEDEVYGKKSPFLHRRRFRGVVVEMVNYHENTMGGTQTANLPFYGARFSGPNTLIGGDTYVDWEVAYHPGAPQYYANGTGNVASGYIVFANMLLEADLPQSKGFMFFAGLGPMIKYQHMSVILNNDPNTGNQKPYSLDDATLGAVVNGGAAMALGSSFDLRADARYYWETQGYLSFGLAIQMSY